MSCCKEYFSRESTEQLVDCWEVTGQREKPSLPRESSACRKDLSMSGTSRTLSQDQRGQWWREQEGPRERRERALSIGRGKCTHSPRGKEERELLLGAEWKCNWSPWNLLERQGKKVSVSVWTVILQNETLLQFWEMWVLKLHQNFESLLQMRN